MIKVWCIIIEQVIIDEIMLYKEKYIAYEEKNDYMRYFDTLTSLLWTIHFNHNGHQFHSNQ